MRADGTHPKRVLTLDVAAEEMCDAGVIFCHSAGNYNLPAWESGSSTDPNFDPNNDGWYSEHYNNFYAFDRDIIADNGELALAAHTKVYYNRGCSPCNMSSIQVGAVGTSGFYSTESFYVDPYSVKGPRVDIYAVASTVNAAGNSQLHKYTSSFFASNSAVPPPTNDTVNLFSRRIGQGSGGTSYSSPQAAGVIALYLQLNPSATSVDVKRWLRSNASFNSGSNPPWPFSPNATPYFNPEIQDTMYLPPTFGAPTQSILFNPFAASPSKAEIKGPFNISPINIK